MTFLYQDYIQRLRQEVEGRSDATLTPYATVAYKKGTELVSYDLFKIASKDIEPKDSVLLIRACIHGNEPAGALTIGRYISEMFTYAHERGVKLIVYPLDNPSGFEHQTRYNFEDDSGACGNNDFLRYTLANGEVVDDLGTGNNFASWHWSSAPEFSIVLPKETAALHAELKHIPLEQVRGVIDFHQDNYIMYPGAYWYGFPDTKRYENIVEEIEKTVRVFKNEHIDSGFLNGPSYTADKAGPDGTSVPDAFDPVTDERGFIERHDGTLPDLFYRLGAQHCITVETTTSLSEEAVDRVNMAWVRGVVDLLVK